MVIARSLRCQRQGEIRMKSRGCHHLTTFSTSYLSRLFVVLGDSFSRTRSLCCLTAANDSVFPFFKWDVWDVFRTRCNWLQTLSRWLKTEKAFTLPFLVFVLLIYLFRFYLLKQTRRQLQPKFKWFEAIIALLFLPWILVTRLSCAFSRFKAERTDTFQAVNSGNQRNVRRVKANFHQNFSRA